MGRNIKCKPDHLCIAIFMLCLSVRFVEYFLIETDKTAIGENVLHKAVGIIILALVLKRVNLSWSDIGFHRNGFISGVLKGVLLGTVCFAVSFGLELAISVLQGNPAHLEIYISSFSLTGSQIKNMDCVFFLLCVLFNVINVWMEEGVFRGLFLKTLSETKPFMQANLAHCNAYQKLYEWRNVICGNVSNGYRLYDPCRDYGNQMGASLPHNRKSMGRAWRPFI